jgi:hypothetical protein
VAKIVGYSNYKQVIGKELIDYFSTARNYCYLSCYWYWRKVTGIIIKYYCYYSCCYYYGIVAFIIGNLVQHIWLGWDFHYNFNYFLKP